VEEAVAPGQVSVWAAAFLEAVVVARVPVEAQADPAAVARAVPAAEVAELSTQEICGVRRGKAAVVAARPE
jgi:hypothetical protein